jgi:ABC-type phosphate transport system substrate-binding protein
MRPGRLCCLLLWSAIELCAAWRITGSDLLAPGFAAAFRATAQNAGLEVSLEFAGSHHGWRALETGRADVALISLAPEQSLPADAWHRVPLAYHGVAVVVPVASPLAQVTRPQLAGIFAASGGVGLRRWGELGLRDDWSVREIAPLVPAENTPDMVRVLVRQWALAGRDFRAGLPEAATPGELISRLEREPGAIGFIRWPSPRAEGFRPVALAADDQAPAFLPTPENIHRGDYGLRWPLWLVFRREAAPRLLPLLRHLYEDNVAAALEEAQFSPLPAAVRRQIAFDLEVLK